MTRPLSFSLINGIVTFAVFIVGQLLLCAFVGGDGSGPDVIALSLLIFMVGMGTGMALMLAALRRISRDTVDATLRKAVADWLIGAELKAKRKRTHANDNRKSRTAAPRRKHAEVPRKRAA